MGENNLSEAQLKEHKLYERKYKKFKSLWIQNKSVPEISKQLGLSEGAVTSKNYLGRLKKARGIK